MMMVARTVTLAMLEMVLEMVVVMMAVVVRARKTRKTRSLPTIVGAAGGLTSHHDGWVRQQVTVGK